MLFGSQKSFNRCLAPSAHRWLKGQVIISPYEFKMFSNSTIVLPWDFSEMSRSALEFAIKRTLPAQIRMVCVLEKPDAFRIGIVSGESEEEHAREECEAQFWSLVDREAIPDLRFDAVFGDPATEIVSFAESVNADLILMPTHGRSGIKRVVLGSVAQKVTQIARYPVLLLTSAFLAAEKDTKQDTDSKIAFKK